MLARYHIGRRSPNKALECLLASAFGNRIRLAAVLG